MVRKKKGGEPTVPPIGRSRSSKASATQSFPDTPSAQSGKVDRPAVAPRNWLAGAVEKGLIRRSLARVCAFFWKTADSDARLISRAARPTAGRSSARARTRSSDL